MRSRNFVYLCAIGVMLSGCGTKPIKPGDQHIQRQDLRPETQSNAPQPIVDSVILPPPKPAAKIATYSVVVTNVPAQEILFALARDAKINLDIQSGIRGTVTINAINQTLPQILDRISKQVDMRYELENGTLTVMPDGPYLKQYKIDYVNMSRDAEGGISNSSQVGASATGGATGGSTTGGAGGNSSQLSIKNSSKNHFWDTLVQNIKDILHETDKILPAGSSEAVGQQSSSSSTGGPTTSGGRRSSILPGMENGASAAYVEEGAATITRNSTFREAAAVIANPEAGIITVRATGKQHEKIQQFIDQVMGNARRQVLIEVTVAEVTLSQNYQQGINWSALAAGTKGFQLKQVGTGVGLGAANTASMAVLSYVNPLSKFGNLSASVSLLESFGNVKVLSSPTLSVMNNQTAMLRVVNNLVYFTIESSTSQAANTTTLTTYTTTPHSVPVGLTMSITPEISAGDLVQVSVRPSITRLLAYVQDPNPTLANPCGVGAITCNVPAIVSLIPEVQTREMESVLKIENNQIAVLGGLMEDNVNNNTDGIPLLASIPIIGEFFKNRNDATTKTELVIFLRPAVIHGAGIDENFSQFRNSLPDQDFFKESASGKP